MLPQVNIVESVQEANGTINRESDLVALLKKQTLIIDAMQLEIKSLQNQLKALSEAKKDVCTVSTNTSFLAEPETHEFPRSTCDSDNESDADDAASSAPPLVGNAIDSAVTAQRAPPVASPTSDFDVPRIRIPAAAAVGESDDDMSEIDAKYLRLLK
ncbi:hypothetical protein DYB32_005253 [Aphanomyces invadans]|nr:hypothetical protein DYB32_005253 [Aphanomyces invadans]